MSELIVTENITVDGVIEATGDWFAPSGDESAEVAEVQQEHMRGAGGVLLGRLTYEQFQGYWPMQSDDMTGVSDYLNRTNKYVVSATLSTPTWHNTIVLRGPLADEVAKLKDEPGKAIVATGSITLVHALLRTGQVDEYRLFVYPVVLGRGRRLFEDAIDVPALRLVDARSFESGVVLVRYSQHDRPRRETTLAHGDSLRRSRCWHYLPPQQGDAGSPWSSPSRFLPSGRDGSRSSTTV